MLSAWLVTECTYSVGVFHADNPARSRTGTVYIHKEHRKEGRGERRSAPRSEEQNRDLLRNVNSRIDAEFKNHALDNTFLGGDRSIRTPLSGKCSHLCR